MITGDVKTRLRVIFVDSTWTTRRHLVSLRAGKPALESKMDLSTCPN
jgi:hypothetical protein